MSPAPHPHRGPEIESLLAGCFAAAHPEEALAERCRAHPELAGILQRRFAMAAEMGLCDGFADGRIVGDFRLIRELGRGGMGVVWLAEQVSLHRRVALKVIRPGIGTEDFARRLRHEAEILGQLQHPGIAQVFEAGAAELAGGFEQPYFAMEYIDGVSLGRYAREHELAPRDRLELFALVCDAVAHAHDHGVIHRDIKPENILVDASGQPKILDFGIARATETDVVHMTIQTVTGQVLGTLPYMSPEQVTGDTHAIDARTDVYALGAILYELMVGRVPLDVGDNSIAEAARLICEREPQRLGRIDPALRGDVETIAGKALAKESELRYPSAAELAADVRRCLADMPIVARSPSTLYYVGKFARRNKGIVGSLTAALIIAVVGALVATTFAALASERLTATERQAYAATISSVERTLRSHDVTGARNKLALATARLRGWEWRHLASRTDDRIRAVRSPSLDNLGYRWRATEGPAAHASIPDGAVWLSFAAPGCVAGAAGGKAFVVDLANGRVRHFAIDDCHLSMVRGHAATARVATGCMDGTLRMFETRTGRLLATDRSQHKRIYSIEFMHDGQTVATSGWDGTVRLFEAATLRPLRVLTGDGRPLWRLRVSADETRIASRPFGIQNEWSVWDASVDDPRVLRGHASYVYDLAFSADGKTLVSAGWLGTTQGEVIVWDIDRRAPIGKPIHTPTSHLRALALSPDGTHLATVDRSRCARVWDLRGETPRLIRARGGYKGNSYGPLTFHADSIRLLWPGGDRLQLWSPDADTLADVRSLRGFASGHASPDGSLLVVHEGQTRLRVIETATLAEVARIPVAGDYRRFAFHAGRLLVTRAAEPAERRAPTILAVVEPRTAEVVARLHHGTKICAIAPAPGAARIAIGTFDGKITIWDGTTYTKLVELGGHSDYVFALAWSPDGSTLASGSGDGTVRIWDTKSMREIVAGQRRAR